MADTDLARLTSIWERSRSAFLSMEPAAFVPPIALSRFDFDKIMLIVETVASLADDVAPNGMEGALIQGSLLAPAVEAAVSLRETVRSKGA